MTDRVYGPPAVHTPRSQINLSIGGAVQGSVLYYDGTSWVPLAPGANGELLTTQGAGANPSWDPAINLPGAAQGSVLYHNGLIWTFLGPGAAGEFLQTQGAGVNPAWAAAAGGAATEAQAIFPPETPVARGTANFPIQVNFWGGTFRAYRPLSFNRMAVYETAGSVGGNTATIAMYQAADGLVVDPWPRLATFTWVTTGGAGVRVLTPNEATPITLATGPFVMMARANVNTSDMASWQVWGPIPITQSQPAGTYPTSFVTALGGAAPATLAFATMGGAGIDASPIVRLFTV
jgi:hypothetical protein